MEAHDSSQVSNRSLSIDRSPCHNVSSTEISCEFFLFWATFKNTSLDKLVVYVFFCSRIVFTAHARALARQKEQVIPIVSALVEPKCHVGGTVNVGLSQSGVETR